MAARRLAIVGTPGTDAHTIGRLLAGRLGAEHVSICRLIDLEVRHQTALGVQIGSHMQAHRGALLPTRLVAPLLDQLWAQRSRAPRASLVISGYPRNAQQWQHLKRHADVSQILHLRGRPSHMRASIAQRAVCPSCDSGLYDEEIVLGDGSRLPAVTECCGSSAAGRAHPDDALDVFESRLAAYEEETVPWLSSERTRGLVADIWTAGRWPQMFPLIEQHLLDGETGSSPAGAATGDDSAQS